MLGNFFKINELIAAARPDVSRALTEERASLEYAFIYGCLLAINDFIITSVMQETVFNLNLYLFIGFVFRTPEIVALSLEHAENNSISTYLKLSCDYAVLFKLGYEVNTFVMNADVTPYFPLG